MTRWFLLAVVAVTMTLPLAARGQVTSGEYLFLYESQFGFCPFETDERQRFQQLRELSPVQSSRAG